MLNIDTINKEILELEKHDTTYATCEKLACLYTVRDHLTKYEEPETEMLSAYGDSDFMKAISGKSSHDVMCVMNELMSTLNVVNPRLYESVMRKL
jgi:hypothetical protein